jgi:endoglucanase
MRSTAEALMPRLISTLLLSLIVSLSVGHAQGGTANPMIHRQGMQLVDGSGQPLHLKGVNLGGWLLWEDWIWGGGFNAEKTVMERLSSLVGATAAVTFQQDIHEHFITEDDIRAIAQLGFNVIRVPLNHTVLEDDHQPYVYKESGWKLLDRLLGWAEKHRISVVLELHAAPGGQSLGFPFDPDFILLWYSEENLRRTVAWWQAVAHRYKDWPIVAGYDLLGEPWPPNGSALVNLYARIIAAIREVDPHHLIILEGADFARDFSMFTAPLDENMAYSFHLYTWSSWWDPNAEFAKLAQYDTLARTQNVPLWNGEMGENTVPMVAATVDLFRADPLVSGWCYWTWKKVPNWFPALVSIQASPNWKKLIEWIGWQIPWAKPTKEEALAGMAEFIQAIRFKNTVVNQEMVEALND